jgi:hypothetical protein
MTIIVEGPDGSGKTTLIQELQHQFPEMQIHPRFCTSLEGPIDNLAEAVYHSTVTKPTHYIHDRHPIISEYVYASAIPTRSVNPAFLSNGMSRLRLRLANYSLMVWCMPSLPQVIENTEQEQQMPGAKENTSKIYEAYMIQRLMWPGRATTFDYTRYEDSWRTLRYVLTDTVKELWMPYDNDK